jgi:hypothetical protein
MNHRAIIGAAIVAVIAGLTAWQASGSVITGIVAGLVPIAALFPTSYKPPTTPAVALLALAIVATPSCGPTTWQGAVLRTADGLRAGSKLTASLMAKASEDELKKCEAKSGKGSDACKAVARKIVKRLKVWQGAVRPAIRSLMAAMVQLYNDVPEAKPTVEASGIITVPAPRMEARP